MKKSFSFYDNLYGYINVDSGFEKIINNEFFMRLHNISQMGMTRYVFPDAVHTRYSHSLGVYHNIERMFLSQEVQFEDKEMSCLSDKEKSTLKLTALLHDVGHIPLSHTTEQAMSRFHFDELQDDSLKGITKQEKQYEENDTKLHERLAQSVLLGPTSLNKVVSELEYSCNDISYGIMGFTREYISEEQPSDKVNLYLSHARNFMHSQLDADRIDYLMRDAAFSGVKAGAFDVEKLLREIRYDKKAHYGVDESGVRALEQFFFARFGAYSQIVFNKKVHGLEYLAQEFYYQLLVEKKKGNIDAKFGDLILSFNDLRDALQNGNPNRFLSFVDSVFYELIEKAVDESLFQNKVPKLNKMAVSLKNGVAPKVVGYEEYFATEEENKFHNSFFEYLRNVDNIKELAKRSGVPLEEIILPHRPLSTKLIDKKKDLLCVFKDNRVKYHSLLESDNSLLKLIQEKRLYLNRLFTFDEDSQDKLKKACLEMSKGFTYPGDF